MGGGGADRQGPGGLLREAEAGAGGPSEGGIGWDWDRLLRLWIEEGFPPETFWDQTERSFAAALEARIETRRLERERDLLNAYNMASLCGHAFAGKLKPFGHYARSGGKAPQTPKQMLTALKAIKASGAAMAIRRVPKRSAQ